MAAKKSSAKKAAARKAKPLQAHARKKKAAARKAQHVAPRATASELLASLPSRASDMVDDLIARIWG